jgi:hypothetical protein
MGMPNQAREATGYRASALSAKGEICNFQTEAIRLHFTPT